MPARMIRRLLVGGLAALVILAASTIALATHWQGSVTDIVDNSVQTQGCHGSPYYFNPIYGWSRSCAGAHDISNSPVSVNIYIRGYGQPTNWTSASIVNAQGVRVYSDRSCATLRGTEYNNAWQISTPDGTIGLGYHHMDNYHYPVGQTAVNGAHIGEMANWGHDVYYCDGSLASTGPHVHMEAARDGTLLDAWDFGGSPPQFPFIRYWHP